MFQKGRRGLKWYEKSQKNVKNSQKRSKNYPIKPLKNALKMSQISAK